MARSDASISTVIVDDEPLGRDLVRHMLKAHGDFQIVAECGDGEKALTAIKRYEPQLVFLDVEMPRLDGMSLLEGLEAEKRPLVVFITAHEGYAVRAFETHALDYLLKPFDQERFDQTLARVRARVEQVAAAKLGKDVRRLLSGTGAARAGGELDEGASSKPWLDRIVIRESGRIYFVGVEEIHWLEASGNYVALHVASGKTHLVHETMANLEAKLEPAKFVRIHRGTIVKVDRIKELQPHFNGEYIVQLKDDVRLKLSRGYLEKARTALGLG